MRLTIDHLGKYYKGGVWGLDDFSLEIDSGVLGLVGPNGAGKSTLMRIIATVTRPTKGTVKWNEQDIVKSPNDIRKVLGYLPQDFGVYPHLNSIEFLTYLASAKGLHGRVVKDRIHHLLEVVNLTDVRKKALGGFSGGMKQRVGIAQALLNNPEILIVDEPTAGLDPEERVRFRNLLTELAESRVVILSSHIVSDIEAATTDVVVIDRGRMIKRAVPEELTQSVEGKVWELIIPSAELATLKNQYVISSTVRTGDGLKIRIVSEDIPHENAGIVPPTLEDAYLYLLRGGRSGEQNG